MYKMIIADDEKIIQEGLERLIDWNKLGFEIVGSFDDGEEVIECLDSMPVDVVLTDIMMTHINGIDVARYVMEEEIPCKVVFISGYKEFDLAIQAIKYGVKDYILKPSKVEDVKGVFRRIKLELDTKAKDLEYLERVEKRWIQVQPILEEKFLNSLIVGALDDRKEIEQRVQLLYPDVEVGKCPCMLVDMEIVNYETFIQNSWSYSEDQFNEAVSNLVSFYQGACYFHVVYKYKGIIRLFAVMKECGGSQQRNIELCERQVEQFRNQLEEIIGIRISARINKVFENIFHVSEWGEEIIKKDSRKSDAEMLRQEQKKLLLDNIIQGNISAAQKILNHVLKSLSGDDMHYCKHLVVDIFSCISELLRENNKQLYELLAPFIDYHSILNMSSFIELEAYCNRMFDKMKSKYSMSDQFNKNGLINQVKTYIQEHICEDILIDTVANEVFISVSHLSRVFKKQTGETFQQYVIRKKMEKAAELLQDSQYKVYQVGEYLGYKTSRHFSKVFLNVMGVYPAEYRKEVLCLGEVADEEE